MSLVIQSEVMGEIDEKSVTFRSLRSNSKIYKSAGTIVKNLKVEQSLDLLIRESGSDKSASLICLIRCPRPKLLPDLHESIVYGRIDALNRVHPAQSNVTPIQRGLARDGEEFLTDDSADGLRQRSSDEEVR